ncbi:alpha/beta hydrolase [Sphingomonas sp. AOB5]|uniref:alpha/beta hydrolase n=1 Tax=Sphingomonas sp. AOB5 TaxID=3034017 RepID=UPI0023F8CA6E|nr:alpha/beta hydrolase [Sphingomonas sp. AOB5]MDF7776115.1 alpha/beta hydrolase [Sphingomonas sp. AOB5]
MSDPRDQVDPELLPLLDLWPQLTLDETTLPLLRQPGRLPLGEIVNPERVERGEAVVPGRDGAPDVALVHYRPAGRAGELLPCIYHIHGGGYVAGTAGSLEPIHRAMVERLDCAIVSVEYRLAPETVFPGPLEDCYAGLLWLFANAEKLGVDARRIGLRGESAGGGLAAALALLARDRGEVTPAFQQLIYPMLDDRTCTADPHPHAGRLVWNHGSNCFGWRSYLGGEPGSDGVSPYAAAARAEQLGGLPPAFVATGSIDLFVDEDIAYAARLIRAGVATELHVYPGGFHAFDVDPAADIAVRMRRDSLHWLARHLRPAAAN